MNEIYYAVKKNGMIVTTPFQSISEAEREKQKLNEATSPATIVQVDDHGREFLFG